MDGAFVTAEEVLLLPQSEPIGPVRQRPFWDIVTGSTLASAGWSPSQTPVNLSDQRCWN